ncbi:MAG TPA: hypothetical protein VK177_20100 [Flavobacteriales bacterium]|nr:hypothetical protein [Flavobacteriales bacterium]
MNLQRVFILLVLMIAGNAAQAQDSIVFTSRVSPGKEYKIPLTKFNVRITTKSNEHFRALIANYNDTAVVVRQLENTRKNRKAARSISRQFWKTTHRHYYPGTAYDSLSQIASLQIATIMYPTEKTLRISEITLIDIHNYDRTEKDKRTRRLDYAGTMGVFAAHYATLAQALPLAQKVYNFSLGFSVEAVVVEKEKLDLVNQWSLKKHESSETALSK